MKASTTATRMKAFEAEFRQNLPARTYTLIRLDGRAFHTYTRNLERPFDEQFANDMDATAVEVLKEAAGARFAYVQSDEISILLTDFDRGTTQAWFGGAVTKVVSISAALATAAFNELRPGKRALFDSRAFSMPKSEDVGQYLRWRQDDARRNSIQAFGQHLFTKKQMHGLKTSDILAKAESEHGQRWDDLPTGFRLGRLIQQEEREEAVTYRDGRTGQMESTTAMRSHWIPRPAPNLREMTRDQYLDLIPQHPDQGHEQPLF